MYCNNCLFNLTFVLFLFFFQYIGLFVAAAMLCVLSIVYKKIDCSVKNGTFGTMQMLQNRDVDVVFGPTCSVGTLI